MIRHLFKPVGLKGPAADAICPERGPKLLAQVRATLGITAPTLVAHSPMLRTRQLATLLFPDAPKLQLDLLGYEWLRPMYGDPYESWAKMEESLEIPVTTATAQQVYDLWPEARSIELVMAGMVRGLCLRAIQIDGSGDAAVVVIGHTGLLEMPFPEDDRNQIVMLGEGHILAFTHEPEDDRISTAAPDLYQPADLFPDIAPEAIELETHPADRPPYL